MTTNEKIEQKAKELFEYVADPLTWEAIEDNKVFQKTYIKLARHALAAEIEASIKELYNFNGTDIVQRRIDQLEQQLVEIKK